MDEEAIWLSVAGIGPERATEAAQRLVGEGVACLVSWGTCAGLVEGLKSGTLMLPQAVVSSDGSHFETLRLERFSRLSSARREPLAEAKHVLETTQAKRTLAERTGAVAADMESGAVARVAREAGLPFLVVRAVIDPVEQALPKAVLRLTDAFGRVQWQRLPGVALTHAPTLWRLGRQSKAAMGTLQAQSLKVRQALAKAASP